MCVIIQQYFLYKYKNTYHNICISVKYKIDL